MDVAVAVRRGRPAWLNRRTMLGAGLVLLSLGGGRALLEGGRATVPMWVAARDVASGAAIDADAVRAENVHLSSVFAGTYLSTDVPVSGLVATRPLAEGELVPAAWVADTATTAGRAITVPVDPEHAVGGALRPGDLVDIFATFDPGDVRARTVVLVRAVELVDIVSAGGLVMGDKALIGITISVDPTDAQRIAFASRTAQLDVVRVDDPSSQSRKAVVDGSDF